MPNYVENLIRGLPGEALIIVAFSEAFIKENVANISMSFLPVYGIIVLIAVFITTFILKYFATGIVKFDGFKLNNGTTIGLIFTLIVSFQAVCYSLVVVGGYIFTDTDISLLVTFLGVIIGLILSAVATIFPKS
ncbi:MAG: hypothetical protein EAX91_10755 [Candidatus Lokiarchaeota archaeon]|nr:hypothetical protein [Candidatus Lokiarchaeota archaeon]